MDRHDDPSTSHAQHDAPATASGASWNPALRPDSATLPTRPVGSPTETTPEPKPELKSETSSEEKEKEEEVEEEDEDEKENEPEEDEDEKDQNEEVVIPATAAPSPAIASIANDASSSQGSMAHDDPTAEDTPVIAPSTAPPPQQVEAQQPLTASSREEEMLVDNIQALSIQHQTPAQTQPDSSDEEEEEEEEEEEAEGEPETAAPAERPAENYEHQGETTALEHAMTESERVPLVAAAAPTMDWGASEHTFDLGGQSAETPLETPHAEAEGTTVGDDTIGNTTVGGNTGEDTWGNVAEEDDFFGGGASHTVEAADTTVQSPGAHIIEDSQTKPEWDLDLDLDDEFLPDTEDAPVLDLDDDAGFLDDEPLVPAEQSAQSTGSISGTANRYAPQGATIPAATPPLNQYAPQGLQPAPSNTPRYDGYGQSISAQQQPLRPEPSGSAQSFVAKSKGGYASPYDLPDDIVTTRRRPAPRTSVPNLQSNPPPPPRSSSVVSNAAPPRSYTPSDVYAASPSPPHSGHAMQPQATAQAPPKPAAPVKSPSNDFFAELPVTTRPKPSTRYTVQPNVPPQPPIHHAPPPLASKERTASWSSLRNEVLPNSTNTNPPLRPPEQLPMFPSQPSVPTIARANTLPIPQPAPPPSSRYSPVPPALAPAANAQYSPVPPSTQPANSRYSPAPGAQGVAHARYASEPHTGPPRPVSQPYAPRTSSPLVHHSVPQQKEQLSPVSHPNSQNPLGHHISQSTESVPYGSFRGALAEVRESEEPEPIMSSRPPTANSPETPPSHSTASSVVGSPRRKTNYTPQYQPPSAIAPPRSQSQSPTTVMKQPTRSLAGLDRSGPGYGYMPVPRTQSAQPTISSAVNSIPPRRRESLNYECIVPTDETAADPLQRWKGHPLFVWGLGGTIATSFPKQIPRYGGGTSVPMMKCSPGEVRIQNVKEMFPLPDEVAKFPGPLKSKSKKKEVSIWLARRIEAFENELKSPGLENSMSKEESNRLQDRCLLWKIMQALVDNDGQLEGPAAEAAVKKILSPEDTDMSDVDASFSTAADIVGRSRTNTLNAQAEPLDPRAIGDIQKMLTKGDREKAVWHAVDQRLWGHAMLLSSTLNKDIWKQVVQEFVRKEVKKVGRNSQALAVLYEVFAGNHEDCIDELVPASARAGFQMVSADGAGAAQNAQQGLDKWRETVALILNNRSEGDAAALLSLGKLLVQYGRVEAAHVCYIFARSMTHISGIDDAQSHLVLVGANHHLNPLDLGLDLEPVLLTEVYEFALSLSAHGSSSVIPHLQTYKLAHAQQLAEYGYRTEAQAYCDAIAAALKATIVSPYYNASFIATLDELSKRLSQSPKDGSSSWISKPSMDKVSSSLLSKFNSFIAGDDEGAASNKTAGVEVGPFAKIPGNSPSITPSQSSADLYGAYAYGVPTGPPAAPGNSKYAPSNNVYTPRTSSDQQRSRYEPGGRPSMDSVDSSRAVSDSYVPSTPSAAPYTPALMSPPMLSPQSARTQAKAQSYSPLRTEHNAPVASYGSPYMSTPPAESASAPAFGGYQPPQASFDDPPPPAAEGQSFNSYEPPTNSFEAPSYEPYNSDDDTQEEKPRRKQFMDDDDDDDLAARASALKISSGSASSKSEADRKADEAFRKAAEEDAKRDKEAAANKKGWFGGWFKKDPNASPGPIKAKLGEENSFYYDPDLKKWVNKKAGAADAAKPSATPPPPRSGPSSAARSSSGMGAPAAKALAPSAMPPRSTSMPPPMGGPPSRTSTPGISSDTESPKPPMFIPPQMGSSGPPSRPGTSMSNASSIDDLLGAPQPRKGAGAKKKKGGRYVEIL